MQVLGQQCAYFKRTSREGEKGGTRNLMTQSFICDFLVLTSLAQRPPLGWTQLCCTLSGGPVSSAALWCRGREGGGWGGRGEAGRGGG